MESVPQCLHSAMAVGVPRRNLSTQCLVPRMDLQSHSRGVNGTGVSNPQGCAEMLDRCHQILTSVKFGAQAMDGEAWPPLRLLSLALGNGCRTLGCLLDQWPDVMDVGELPTPSVGVSTHGLGSLDLALSASALPTCLHCHLAFIEAGEKS